MSSTCSGRVLYPLLKEQPTDFTHEDQPWTQPLELDQSFFRLFWVPKLNESCLPVLCAGLGLKKDFVTVLHCSPVFSPLPCDYFPLPWEKRNLLISVSFPLTFIAPHCYVITAWCYQWSSLYCCTLCKSLGIKASSKRLKCEVWNVT